MQKIDVKKNIKKSSIYFSQHAAYCFFRLNRLTDELTKLKIIVVCSTCSSSFHLTAIY